MMADQELTTSKLLDALKMVGETLDWPTQIEILLVGGAAGMVTQVFAANRTTEDCDIAALTPVEAADAIARAAQEVAPKKELPANWLDQQALHFNVLPVGWRSRRRYVATYGKLVVYAASRLDLLAMKVAAHRAPDRADVAHMKVTPDEIEFIRKHLNLLKVPSRGADLDQVEGAERYLRQLAGEQP